MMKKTAIILTLGILFSFSATAQMLGMNLSMFQAQGEFNKNIDSDPIGLSFTYHEDVDESPVSVGGELGIAMYSSQEFDTFDNDGQQVTVYEEDCFYNLHGILQYKLVDLPSFELYSEGRIGLTTFFSEQHPKEATAALDNSFKIHGTAFNLGLGGGLRINLSGLISGDPTEDMLWLDGAYTTNNGTRTTYRNAGEDTILLTDARFRSFTDYAHLRVGIAVRI